MCACRVALNNTYLASQANDGSRGHGCVQCQPSLVRRESMQKLPLWDVPPHPLHQHSEFIPFLRTHSSPMQCVLENGPRRMPQVAHRTSEDRVPRRARSESQRPRLCTLPDRVRVQHLRLRGRVRPEDPCGAPEAGKDSRGERKDNQLGMSYSHYSFIPRFLTRSR